ncbi:MAG: hypothetical protein JRG97_09550, partial [Deltaproteobacteria bacterium]|nr:hypothetical protein [Deltaproteobacteria bacterium]
MWTHYLEEEGLATAHISLVREHTETIRPPRALWVTFEMGRPLGVPNDPDFQKRVLRATLKLLEASSGPVLEDFPEDAAADEAAAWACPVSFDEVEEDLSDEERLLASFKREMDQLRSWYDIAVRERGRTTVGVSGVKLDDLADFICAFLGSDLPENPKPEISLPLVLNLAIDDLKAYYTEAVSAQPGQNKTDSERITDWFWDETAAGKLLFGIKEACVKSE